MNAFHAQADMRPRRTNACAPSAAGWPCGEGGPSLYLRRLFLPLGRENDVLVVALADDSAENRTWIAAAYGAVRFETIAKDRLIAQIARRFGPDLADAATFALARRFPLLSARCVVTQAQGWMLGLSAAALVVVALWRPLETLVALVILLSLLFEASAVFRGWLAWLGGVARVPAEAAAGSDLPRYTILVPLYREAAVLPELVRALAAMDYPGDRLQVLLVVEADDDETVRAAEALLAPPFEIVRVPPGLPRTKPKAANYALQCARGDYVVVYDAEDRPEPDQLRKAVALFRNRPRETACLQARLVPHNLASWLVKLFWIDFALWFGAYLPGLERLGVPIPLGGTSNHFRAAVLREVGAWDPFNVTEDADLGLRLAAFGYRVAMLDSVTYEEMPAAPGAWIRQRSRWLKGYMQTWLVHGRGMRERIARVGVGGFLTFHLFIGGAVLSALANPLLWAVSLLSCFVSLPLFGREHALAALSLTGVVGANATLTYLAVVGARRQGENRFAAYGFLVAVYWLLISVAGYRALWHLLVKPFHWEKTTHGSGNA
jgi:glycosyltransferase XagB